MILKKKYLILFLVFIFIKTIAAKAQQKDSTHSNWSMHFQSTVIVQDHSGFHAPYSGANSLADTVEPIATSITATLFIGRKLWKGGTLYFDPEVSGGNGLSFTKGVAGALNGETYRVGAASPQVFIARAYLQQNFSLGKTSYSNVDDEANQVADKIPDNRIVLTAGKFAISDFFDDNSYSKDPRTQFFNWSLWANGAWDYPANTRGYTEGILVEMIKPTWALRFASVAVPRIANFHLMEYNIHAHSETAEFEHSFSIDKRPGIVRFFASNTFSKSPSYQEGIKAISTNNIFLLDVISGDTENTSYGGRKLCLGLNAEQQLSNSISCFARAGWNDGKYVSWAFTEIDKTLNAGFSIKGNLWKRSDDLVGIAAVINGISKQHQTFLEDGGYGFIIGDSKLNYGHEGIFEAYYNAKLSNFFWLSFDYQFVNNPGYNKDRGPANVFAIRAHVEL